MRSFQIGFIRARDGELEYNSNLLQPSADMWADETEFDTDAKTPEDIFCDLINLFNNFIDENNYTDVTVEHVYEIQ